MITFDELTHTYTNEDGKKLISVTQLMQKHGLAPNYDGVPSDVLKAKAERGTLIHAEIEEYIKHQTIGFTDELMSFIGYCKLNFVDVLKSEFKVFNDIVAGTVDLYIEENGTPIIADIKTTATLHKEAVSWQLSIYAYLSGLKVDKGQAFHFDKNGNLNVVDIPLKPMDQIEALMECERKGEIFKPANELASFDKELSQLANIEANIKNLEEMKKRAEANAQEMRDALMQAMVDKGVKSFENDRIKLTYVAPTTRSSIDSAKLKKEMPDIAAQYEKISNVKASLRITLKGGNE